MATYPSLSYSITQRCKIHDGSVTQNGIISWSIEGQAEAAFNPSKANYLTDTSGWYSRYYWAANSGTYTFDTDAYTFSVTGTTTVYTKTIVKSSTGSLVSSYSTESEASAACAGVANSAFYIYEYKLESGKYNVYRYDLSVQTTSQDAILTKNISLSGYVDRTYTTPYVTGVSFGSTTQVRMPHYSGTGTGSASMLSYTISVYNPGGVSYTPSRTVNNSNSSVIGISHSQSSRSGTIEISTKSIGTSTITVSSEGYSDSVDVTTYGVWTYGSDSDSVYCSFSNVQSGDTLSVTAGSKTNTVTASGTSQNVWVTGLSSSTSYSVSASVNGTTVWSGTITTDAATPSPSVSSVTISGDDTHSLTVGESKTINYSISISNDNGSYTPSVSVTSSNSTAVSYSDLTKSRISGSFKINALAAGSATITVTAGNKTDIITVNSTAAAPEVTVPSVDSWFITNNSIGVRIKDLNAGEVATLKVGSQTKTATSINGGSLDLIVDGLSAGTSYDIIVSTDLNGTIWSGQKTTEATMPDIPDTIVLVPEIAGWLTTSTTIKVAVRNLAAGEEITLTVGSQVVKLTAEANGVGLDLTAIGLTPNTTYTVSLNSNINGTLFSGSKKTSTAGSKKKGAYIGVAEYTELEYIESTGTQYIDTGFAPSSNTRIVIDFENIGDYSSTPAAAAPLFGARAATTSDVFGMWIGATTYPHYGDVSYSASGGFSVDINARLNYELNGNVASIGTETITCGEATFASTCNLYLLGMNTNGKIYAHHAYGRIYSCQIYENGVFVRDFIPCRRSDGSVGMYDKVSNSFFANSGTGEFVAGHVIYGIGDSKARKVKKQYVGIDNTARRIKKAYIGIGGVARPCFGGGELAYYGKITGLRSQAYDLAATTVGDYALFAGGQGVSGRENYVTAYNKSLARSAPTAMHYAVSEHAAATIGNYALFGGGYTGSSYVSGVTAYDSSLTLLSSVKYLSIQRYRLAATTVGNYALFGGGYDGNDRSDVVDAFDASLTRKTPSVLAVPRYHLTATTVGDYALFGGGNRWGGVTNVDAYNSSLTRSTPTALSVARLQLAATTVGGYALFGGGEDNSSKSTLDVYDESLTHTTGTSLSVARSRLAATTVGDYALFGGGLASTYSAVVDAYDTSLTLSVQNDLSVDRYYITATTVGDYALFGGGHGSGSTSYKNEVDVYTVQ